MQGIQNEVY